MKIIRLACLILSAWLAAACCTLLNAPDTVVTLPTTVAADCIRDGDTLSRGSRSTSIRVKRSGKPLRVTMAAGENRTEVTVRPKLDGWFWGNILNYGMGMYIDLHTPRKFDYRTVYNPIAIDSPNGVYDTRQVRRAGYELLREKGRWYCTFGLPWVGFYSTFADPVGERRTSAGFMGVSLTADYHYARRHSVSFGISASTDLIVPFPAAVRYEGNCEFQSRINFSAADNYHLRRFSFGYGLNISRDTWRYSFEGNPPEDDTWHEPPLFGEESISDMHWAAGLVFSGYFKASRVTDLGVVYRPTFRRFGTSDPWKYEHAVNIEVRFRLNPPPRF